MRTLLILIFVLWSFMIPDWLFAGTDSSSPSGKSHADSVAIWDSLAKKHKVNNNAVALAYARKKLKHAQHLNTDEALISAYMLMGEVFFWSSKDSCFIYYSRANRFIHNKIHIKTKIIVLYNLANLYQTALDTKNAIIYLDSVINLGRDNNVFNYVADAYNVLGNIKKGMQERENAIAMYDSCFQIASRNNLYRQMGISLGNIANLEPDDKKSLKAQREAIGYLEKAQNKFEEIGFILINIGLRYVNNPDSALNYFNEALKLGIKSNVFEVQMGAYNNMAYSYLDKSDLYSAEEAIQKAIPIALKARNNDWLSTLYDTYADILTSKGDYKKAAEWQKKALTEKITADKKLSAGQSRLLAALLDTKNKEMLIKNKEFEILQQSNRLQQTRFWLVISIILIILVSFIFYWYQQRSRMKLKNEQVLSAKKIIELEEGEKGRIARELHDITGQLVMGITSEIENLEIPSSQVKDEIQEKIKSLGKSIRQISHRMNRSMMDHFSFEEMMNGQCEDVQRLTGIPIFLNLPESKIDLPKDIVLHIYRIFQELLTNASKYVKDGEVYITIVQDGQSLKISYSDTGPGFDMGKVKTLGMGLMNIFERSKLMGGNAVMDSSPGNGTSWEITVPVVTQKVLV